MVQGIQNRQVTQEEASSSSTNVSHEASKTAATTSTEALARQMMIDMGKPNPLLEQISSSSNLQQEEAERQAKTKDAIARKSQGDAQTDQAIGTGATTLTTLAGAFLGPIGAAAGAVVGFGVSLAKGKSAVSKLNAANQAIHATSKAFEEPVTNNNNSNNSNNNTTAQATVAAAADAANMT